MLARRLPRLGGSHAQRDVFLRSLAELAARRRDHAGLDAILGLRRRLKREDRFVGRLASRPTTPAPAAPRRPAAHPERQGACAMTIDRRTLLAGATAAAAAAVAVLARTGTSETMPASINTLGSEAGIAIEGTDPVAYFVEGRPRAGRPEYAVDYEGARWLFSSEGNKALFEADPARYLPAYGGYCAYGVAQGYLVKIEPEAWTIHEGRLYLNYDLGVRDTWLKDVPGYVAEADRNFPSLAPGGG
jgi:YHS domain-containing protein